MPFHIRPLLQLTTLSCKDLCNSFRGEVHIDEGGADIGDLAIFGNMTVTNFHDRDAFEDGTSLPRFRQPRSKAEAVARVQGLTVEARIHHIPAKFVGIPVEPYVNQFRDPLPSRECAIKDIMIDTVLAEQLRETLSIMLLNRAAKFSQQVLYVHLAPLHPEVAAALRCAAVSDVR